MRESDDTKLKDRACTGTLKRGPASASKIHGTISTPPVGWEKSPAIEVVRRAVESRLGRFTKADILELCPTLGKTSVGSSFKKLVDQGVLIQHGKGRAASCIRACSLEQKL